MTTAPSTFDPAGYKEAKSLFEQSKAAWEEYDDPGKVAACKEKITLCDDEISKIEKTKVMVIIAVVGVIVVVVVVVVVVIWKRKKVS